MRLKLLLFLNLLFATLNFFIPEDLLLKIMTPFCVILKDRHWFSYKIQFFTDLKDIKNGYNESEYPKSISLNKIEKMGASHFFKFYFTVGTELSKFKFQSDVNNYQYISDINNPYKPDIAGGLNFDFIFPSFKTKLRFSSGLFISHHSFSKVYIKDIGVAFIYDIKLNELELKIPAVLKLPVFTGKSSLFIYAGLIQNIGVFSNSYFDITVDFGNQSKHYHISQETGFSTNFTAGLSFERKISKNLSIVANAGFERDSGTYELSDT